MKCLILIPCYNTHEYLDKLLILIRAYVNTDILILDDGSSPILEINNDNTNISIIRNSENQGKGYSINKGFKYAVDNNFTHVLTIDGDMQHEPKEIINFLSIDSGIDFILGTRSFSHPMPFHRKLSNIITSQILSILLSKPIKDSQCGYRRYKLSSIVSQNIEEKGYLFESEILLKSINENSTIENMPIPTIYSGSKSNINNVRDTLGFVKLIIKHIIA